MKSHRTDGVSLTFGLVFLVIVAWYLIARAVTLDLPKVGWFVASGLIVLGMLGLAGALRSSRRAGTGPAPQTGPVPVPGAHQVTDSDRAPVAELLRAALDDGRLDFTEYNERLQQAYTAVTYEELDRAVAGLPGAGRDGPVVP